MFWCSDLTADILITPRPSLPSSSRSPPSALLTDLRRGGVYLHCHCFGVHRAK